MFTSRQTKAQENRGPGRVRGTKPKKGENCQTSPREEKSRGTLDASPISSRLKKEERLPLVYPPLLQEKELGPVDRRYRKGRFELVYKSF